MNIGQRDREWAARVADNIIKRFIKETNGWHVKSSATDCLRLVVLAELLKGIRGEV